MNVPNQGLLEMTVVNLLSHEFVSFLYSSFIVLCPSSTQQLILILSAAVQFTGNRYNSFYFLNVHKPGTLQNELVSSGKVFDAVCSF
jgi:hypothetical protein